MNNAQLLQKLTRVRGWFYSNLINPEKEMDKNSAVDVLSELQETITQLEAQIRAAGNKAPGCVKKQDEINVRFVQWENGEVMALFPGEQADARGNITSYMHNGQHGAASPEMEYILNDAPYHAFAPLLKELISIGYTNLYVLNKGSVTYYRKPTKGETARGYGATHYIDVTLNDAINNKTGNIHKWLIHRVDGSRYYR